MQPSNPVFEAARLRGGGSKVKHDRPSGGAVAAER
jgi:hypothetical protein